MLKDKLIEFVVKSAVRSVLIRAIDKDSACNIFLMKYPDESIIWCRPRDIYFKRNQRLK